MQNRVSLRLRTSVTCLAAMVTAGCGAYEAQPQERSATPTIEPTSVTATLEGSDRGAEGAPPCAGWVTTLPWRYYSLATWPDGRSIAGGNFLDNARLVQVDPNGVSGEAFEFDPGLHGLFDHDVDGIDVVTDLLAFGEDQVIGVANGGLFSFQPSTETIEWSTKFQIDEYDNDAVEGLPTPESYWVKLLRSTRSESGVLIVQGVAAPSFENPSGEPFSFPAVVTMRVDPATGALIWARAWANQGTTHAVVVDDGPLEVLTAVQGPDTDSGTRLVRIARQDGQLLDDFDEVGEGLGVGVRDLRLRPDGSVVAIGEHWQLYRRGVTYDRWSSAGVHLTSLLYPAVPPSTALRLLASGAGDDLYAPISGSLSRIPTEGPIAPWVGLPDSEYHDFADGPPGAVMHLHLDAPYGVLSKICVD